MHTSSQNKHYTHQPIQETPEPLLLILISHHNMVSLQEPLQPEPEHVIEPILSPRLSFSADSLDDNSISISPKQDGSVEIETGAKEVLDFEFLSGDKPDIVTADELFCEGKLLPFWQMEKLNKIELKTVEDAGEGPTGDNMNNEERRISWFLDDDPSPRPPNCTVLWKELLRLKKRRPPTLSPSSSSSSSESLSVGQRKEGGERVKVKKGLERTRSGSSMRIRPMINVPICTAAKNPSLPPLFPLRRRRLES